MHVTSFYAALLTIVFVSLSVRVLRLRRSLGIAIGDAGNSQMLRAMRVQANCAEYVPLGLVLLILLELQNANTWLIHSLGISLLCGRLLHAYGVSQPKEPFGLRVAGMALTLTSLLTSTVYLLILSAERVNRNETPALRNQSTFVCMAVCSL